MSGKNKKVKRPINKGIADVPVIMQLEALECGAACLAMVLAYYDKWIPLEQVRSDCGVSRDGSKASSIVKAARQYGLIAEGFRMEPEELRESGTFPCIIHWNFNHFVVVRGFRGNRVYINDPANGDYSVSMETFDKSFTGICLTFTPSDGFIPEGKPKSVINFAKKRLVGARVSIAFVIVTSVITSLVGLIYPVFSRVFIDRLLTGENPKWFIPFIIGLSFISLIQIVVGWIREIYMLRINGKLSVVGSTSYMWKVLRLPMEFFSQRMAGDIQQREGKNAVIAQSIVVTFAPLLLNSLMLIFYLVVMIRYSLILSVIGILSVIFNLFFSRLISKKRVNITRVQMRDAGKLAGATVAGIEMIETIKASGAENGYFEKWSGYQASVNTQQVKYSKLNQYLGLLPGLISAVTDTVVLMIGVWLAINGKFTVGMIMAFQGFLAAFVSPAQDLITAGQKLQEMRTEMERIEDVMEYRSDEIYNAKENEEGGFDKLLGNVDINHVTFGYSKLGEPVIRDFNLSLKQGNCVAIVGRSGCGKSTITKLVSGLYKPWQGEILFDGKPINEISRSVFTGSVAVVDQDIVLFEDTVSNNIKMWDGSIEDYEMIIAATDAQIHSDIMQRPKGYMHSLVEGGKDFSGGQRQRMEIARALSQDPIVLILDEATSALDAKTEFNLVQAVRKRGVTCIIVAHRLSTIRDCDEIIVLENGVVVDRGTHDELMSRKDGVYVQLVSNE